MAAYPAITMVAAATTTVVAATTGISVIAATAATPGKFGTHRLYSFLSAYHACLSTEVLHMHPGLESFGQGMLSVTLKEGSGQKTDAEAVHTNFRVQTIGCKEQQVLQRQVTFFSSIAFS